MSMVGPTSLTRQNAKNRYNTFVPCSITVFFSSPSDLTDAEFQYGWYWQASRKLVSIDFLSC